MTRAYAFIDGAAFEASVRPHLDLFGASIRDIMWDSMTASADRIFYFDALPQKRQDEDEAAFRTRFDDKKAFFSWLSRVPNMHVREGFTRVRSGGRRPSISQKGVDIALATEVLTHAHSGNIDEARIYANDLDFFPVFDALTNTKVKTVLFYARKKIANELLEAADKAEELSPFKIYTCLPSTIRDRLTIEGPDPITDGADFEILQSGAGPYGECSVHYNRKTEKYLLLGPMGDRGQYRLCSNSLELLVSHFELNAGFYVQWKPQSQKGNTR